MASIYFNFCHCFGKMFVILLFFNAYFPFLFYIIQHVLQDNIPALKLMGTFPVKIYLLKVNNRDTTKRCKISSKLIIKTPERRHWRRSNVFIVNFEHNSHLFLTFLLLTEHESISWVGTNCVREIIKHLKDTLQKNNEYDKASLLKA